ncbi:uncharacterized protein LOC135084832 [Ostrinia nubilalis]|uniref:uncharacterized protein LOC135084832 n=1 Tax=Ostrinia nubilalis TaxID=29057 RepID=UPI003082243E
MLLAVVLLAWSHGPGAWGSHTERDGDHDADIYDRYDEKAVSSSSIMTSMMSMLSTQSGDTGGTAGPTRIRREDQTPPVRTLSPNEISEVRGVLKEMMAGRNLSDFTQDVTNNKRLVDLLSSTASNQIDLSTVSAYMLRDRYMAHNTEPQIDKKLSYLRGVYYKMYIYTDLRCRKEPFLRIKYHGTTCPSLCVNTTTCKSWVVVDSRCDFYDVNQHDREYCHTIYDTYSTYYEIRSRPTTPTTTTTTTTTTTEAASTADIIDIRKLVAIIANLTMNTIESNLTELFNATLQKYGIPMCGDTTTTEEPTYDFVNASIISKCFVCGMGTPGIPRNAYCADAFAGDFLPLVPVDPRAKGQIATYRKYCRYLDVPGMLINETQPRSVFGRWTGGCSVRWIDLSGVYTQRACRNRRHATMGQHYVSKRMAKLEMALKNEDNGCIISPMSSLVPLSRGISLYARFHACVCTGSWCNVTPGVRAWQGTVVTWRDTVVAWQAWLTIVLITAVTVT